MSKLNLFNEKVGYEKVGYEKVGYEKVGYAFDPVTMNHKSIMPHLECPNRVGEIFARLVQQGLIYKMIAVQSRDATDQELLLVHEADYLQKIKKFFDNPQFKASDAAPHFASGDLYVSHQTEKAARSAAGSSIALMEKMLFKEIQSGVAIVRPPGHHATSDTAMGFCLYNNVALASYFARTHDQKIAIIDWDVHHGNGTEEIVKRKNDPNVFFTSIHRYDKGVFYPGSGKTGNRNSNILNIGISKPAVGVDIMYLELFKKTILPKLKAFNPNIIVVSAGFDACQGDPLGEYKITPQGYADMTELLQSITPRILLVLEGGYNLTQIPLCMEACVRKLLETKRI